MPLHCHRYGTLPTTYDAADGRERMATTGAGGSCRDARAVAEEQQESA